MCSLLTWCVRKQSPCVVAGSLACLSGQIVRYFPFPRHPRRCCVLSNASIFLTVGCFFGGAVRTVLCLFACRFDFLSAEWVVHKLQDVGGYGEGRGGTRGVVAGLLRNRRKSQLLKDAARAFVCMYMFTKYMARWVSDAPVRCGFIEL